MFNADARSAPRSLARRGLKHRFPRMKVGKSVIHWRKRAGGRALSRAKFCAENFGIHNSFHRSIDGIVLNFQPPLKTLRDLSFRFYSGSGQIRRQTCRAILSLHLNNFTIKTRMKYVEILV
jgi:hypothetical protein